MSDGSVDCVFTFSTESWDDAQKRQMARPPDRLLETMMQSPRVGRLLVANPFRSAPIRLARSLLGRRDTPFPVTEDRDLVTPLRLRRSDPRDPRHVERAYRRYDERLHRASRTLDQQDPVVITMHPFVAGFAPLEWARSVTFYARDDWASFPPMRPWWPAVRVAYERIRSAEVRVCAVSQPILDRIAPTGPSMVVPNGVVPDEWLADSSVPEWFTELSRPRLLYTGTLDDRLDVAAFASILRALPTASLVLLGPVADEAWLRPLLDHRRSRVRFAGSRPELTAVTRAADVGLLPHRRTDLTKAMSPLKLYEYLAAGLPVAATDLPPVRTAADPGRVVLVAEDDDFAAAVKEALDRGRAPERDRLRFLRDNSWPKRHQDVLDLALD